MCDIPANIEVEVIEEPVIHGMIDAHAHHNSGATCPLPLLYNQIPTNLDNGISRNTVEALVSILYSGGVNIQRLSTVDMGSLLTELNTDMYKKEERGAIILKNSKKLNNIKENINKIRNGRDITQKELFTNAEWEKLEQLKNDIDKIKKIISGEDPMRNAIPSLIIVPTMDMELAHINGYDGKFIYQQEGKKIYYYQRNSGVPEEDGRRFNISHERKSEREIKKLEKDAQIQGIPLDEDDILKFQRWKQQVKDTEGAAVSNPLRLFPLFFYDPRRYRYESLIKQEEIFEARKIDNNIYPDASMIKRCSWWEKPFEYIVGSTLSNNISNNHKIWFGFKMYPSLGYRPFDELCDYLPQFYKKCEDEKTPILTHCSPGGMTTHDAAFYKEHDKDNDIVSLRNNKKRSNTFTSDTNDKKLDRDDNMDYFYKTYGHPENWRPVLNDYPKLHLCLAHFGGNEWAHPSMINWLREPKRIELMRNWIRIIIELTRDFENVYTDISCWDIDNEYIVCGLKKLLLLIQEGGTYGHLKKKLIFGSDWYLTYLTPIAKNAKYDAYCNKFKNIFYLIDPSGELWERATLINPWDCYSLSIDKFENIYNILPELKIKLGVKFDENIAKATLDKLRELAKYIPKRKEELRYAGYSAYLNTRNSYNNYAPDSYRVR